MVDQVQRKIFFHRLRVSRRREVPDPAFGREVIKALQTLDRNAGEHYLERGPGEFLLADGRLRKGFPSVRIGVVRRSDLPMIERNGVQRPLDLDDDEGVMDVTHLVIFPSGIVGEEFNHRGPRASVLPWYLRTVCPDLTAVQISILINPETEEALNRLTDVSLLELEISRPQLALLEQADADNADIWEAIRANGDFWGGDNIHLMIGKEPYRRGGIRTDRLPLIGRLFRNDGFREASRKLRVAGFDPERGERVLLDLLDEKLVTERRVAKIDRHRVVQAERMFDEIRGAYDDLSERIARAAGIDLG